jgi:hypothetical protein
MKQIISIILLTVISNLLSAQTTTTQLKVKLFFKQTSTVDEEGNSLNCCKIYDQSKEFQKDKKYIFCYDSEAFNDFRILGNGTNYSFYLYKGSKIIFKKLNFSLSGQMSFKELKIDGMESESYTLKITQGTKTVFLGKISSQGCM